jgi:hypothetical protein
MFIAIINCKRVCVKDEWIYKKQELLLLSRVLLISELQNALPVRLTHSEVL